ncbi:aldo/keto reductase [Fulvivirgaceae bacterium BMA10]|uniref:Aldo/keto reductase n=1 Tax=Splendidivirga corallicola TaxID=3051826 RepID=A0ABT8L113_9BACT|nr:aldo/keto reductase [Fulvivirgaceae bacterium BMA10]
MEYRRLGKSGLLVSELSLGSWLTFGKQIDKKLAQDCMFRAYDLGVNFFDNAEVYANGKSEEVMGEILKKSGWARDTFVVSSKVFWGGEGPNQKGLSRKRVVEACHAALKRLQVDYLDLYFCHRPDLNTPVEETVRAMNDLIQQGKVLYWGTSEWSAAEIMEAYGIARQYNLVPPTMEQPQYHMFHRKKVERDYFKLYREIGLGTTIWSPLASGLLTGKYNDGIPQDSRAGKHGDLDYLMKRLTGEEARKNIEKVKELQKISGDLNISIAVMALAWCLKNPNVSTVITGASKVHQVEENMTAIKAKELLNEDLMNKIEAILQNKPEIIAF